MITALKPITTTSRAISSSVRAIPERPAEEFVRLYRKLRSKNPPATEEYLVKMLGFELLRNGAHDKALVCFEETASVITDPMAWEAEFLGRMAC